MIQELIPTDLYWLMVRLPRDIKKVAETHGLMVSGGFLRATIAGEKVSDIDLFGPTKEILKMAAQEICIERKGRMFETDNAITVLTGHRIPLQFITRWLFTDVDSLINSFDYTIAQAALFYSNGKWHGVCSDRFYPDLAARRLHYTHPIREEEAAGSLMRARKFIAKGYNIQAESLAGIVARVAMKVDWNQIQNDEKKLTRVIAGLLREVDPLTIVDGVDIVDEHAIKIMDAGEVT